jgi:hypothetical protein
VARRHEDRALITVTLSCGCRIKLRDRPMPDARYSCVGTGHGYRLRWESYTWENGKDYPRVPVQDV